MENAMNRSCLVCREKTTSEGQLCPACVAKGHHVENDTLYLNIEFRGPSFARD